MGDELFLASLHKLVDDWQKAGANQRRVRTTSDAPAALIGCSQALEALLSDYEGGQ